MNKMSIEDARKEYKEMMKLGMYNGAELLKKNFLFWHNVDIST